MSQPINSALRYGSFRQDTLIKKILYFCEKQKKKLFLKKNDLN